MEVGACGLALKSDLRPGTNITALMCRHDLRTYHRGCEAPLTYRISEQGPLLLYRLTPLEECPRLVVLGLT